MPLNTQAMMEHINTNNTDIQKDITLKVLRGVIFASPVLSGRYKGSHLVSQNGENTRVTENEDPSGGRTLSQGTEVISRTQFFSKTYVQTNLPYPARLEWGWSEQAPLGIYMRVAQDVRNSV